MGLLQVKRASEDKEGDSSLVTGAASSSRRKRSKRDRTENQNHDPKDTVDRCHANHTTANVVHFSEDLVQNCDDAQHRVDRTAIEQDQCWYTVRSKRSQQ